MTLNTDTSMKRAAVAMYLDMGRVVSFFEVFWAGVFLSGGFCAGMLMSKTLRRRKIADTR